MVKKLQNLTNLARPRGSSIGNIPFAQPSPALASGMIPKMSPTFQGFTPLMGGSSHSSSAGNMSMLNDSFELTRPAPAPIGAHLAAAATAAHGSTASTVAAATAALMGGTPAMLGMSPAVSSMQGAH